MFIRVNRRRFQCRPDSGTVGPHHTTVQRTHRGNTLPALGRWVAINKCKNSRRVAKCEAKFATGQACLAHVISALLRSLVYHHVTKHPMNKHGSMILGCKHFRFSLDLPQHEYG